MLRILSLLSLLVIIPNIAQAVEINDAGAKTLKTSFQNILNYQKNLNDALDSVRLIYEGELTVTQESEFYTVTFPRILIKGPAEHEEDETFDFGIVKINAMPGDKPHEWKTRMVFPSSMTMKNKKQTVTFQVDFEGQDIIGILNDRLNYFTKMNMNLSNMGFTINGENPGINLGGLQLYMNMNEDNDSLFSGPLNIVLSNLSIAPPEEDENVNIGELKIEASIDKIMLPTLQEYEGKLLEFIKEIKALEELEETEETPQTSPGFVNTLMDLYGYDMNGFTFGYSGKDINVSSKTGENASFKLDNGELNFGFNGLNEETGGLEIKSTYSGLTITEEGPSINDLMPSNGNFHIKAINIPYTSLTEVAKTTAQNAVENPDAMQMAGLGLVMRLPAILSQAGTEIIVENNGISNDIYNVNLNGKVVTDLTAMMSFSAKFKAVFEGMDALLTTVKAQADNPEFTDFSQTLEKMKNVGVAETGPNGKPAYSFTFETTPQGQFLINGKPPLAIFSDTPKESETPAE